MGNHKHQFKVGKNIILKYCNVKIGVMQRCNARNPNYLYREVDKK